MFRDLDIRGQYGTEITEEKFARLGAAASGFFKELVAGHDYRPHNDTLLAAFTRGFGQPIRYLGAAPSPAIAFLSKKAGISLTASHNPAAYNGAKFFQRQSYVSESLMQEMEKKYTETEDEPARKPANNLADKQESLQEYEDSLPEIGRGIFDLAGGAVCRLAHLFPKTLFWRPDPGYERHDPEPKDATLAELKRKTSEENEVGFAFDGDGDRVMAADQGKVLEGDVTAAFAATRLLKKHDALVLSIDCRQEVFQMLQDEGFRVLTSKVGDANVLRVAVERQAAFSAERSGHYAFPSHVPNSDGIYAAAKLSDARPGELLEFSRQFKNVTLKEEIFTKADFGKMAELARGKAQSVETLDGVKAVYEEFTLLVRASTTEPKIRINSEARTAQKAKEGLRLAREWIEKSRA